MGVRQLEAIAERLIAGGRPELEPAAVDRARHAAWPAGGHGDARVDRLGGRGRGGAGAGDRAVRPRRGDAPAAAVVRAPDAARRDGGGDSGAGAGQRPGRPAARRWARRSWRRRRSGSSRSRRGAEVERYDLVCLTSPNGVRFLFERMAAAGRDARALAGARVAAIGPGTAAALARARRDRRRRARAVRRRGAGRGAGRRPSAARARGPRGRGPRRAARCAARARAPRSMSSRCTRRWRSRSARRARGAGARRLRDLHLVIDGHVLLRLGRRPAGRGRPAGEHRPGDERGAAGRAVASPTSRPSSTTSTGWWRRWWRTRGGNGVAGCGRDVARVRCGAGEVCVGEVWSRDEVRG